MATNQSPTLFDDTDLQGIQPSGSPWVISDTDPATVPVPLQVVIKKVDGPYTAKDRKLWTFLLHAAFDKLGNEPIHSIKVREVNSIFRELGGEHGTEWIWESAKRLAKTTIEFETTMGDERFLGIAALFGANVPAKGKRGSELHFFFPPNLIPIIKEPMRFARLRVHFMLKLSGKYAVSLYEILEGYANRRDGECRVTVDELRTWLKVPNDAYPAWKAFRQWVLEPAVKQINDDPMGAGFSVEYEPVRKGRFYNEIIFKLTKTDERRKIEKSIKNNGKSVAPIIIPRWAEEKAREAAHAKGWDYAVLRENWLEFAKAETAKGNPPKDAGAAFVAFCRKQDALR